MKIAIIIRKLNIKGGVQRHALHVARELRKLGHTIKFYTFIYDKAQCYPELLNGLEVVSLEALPQPSRVKILGYLNYFIGLAREAAAAKKLAEMIDTDTEVLNPHDHVCYKVAYFFKRCAKNIPSVWTMHDMPTKTFSFVREQAINPDVKISTLKKIFYKLVDWYDARKYIHVQDAIAVLDARDREWVKQYFNKDARVVRNGVDAERFSFKAHQPIQHKKIRLFMNGIFMPHRRFEDGIEAVKMLLDRGYDASMEIAGDYGAGNEYYDTIAQLVSELGLKVRVEFLGLVSEVELLLAYQRNDVFVFSNHLQSWGLAVFEAMATGMPVIVSRSAGASEVLVDKKNAMLVEPKRPGDLAAAIIELIQDPNLYRALSVAGRRFVEEEISWARTARMMQEMFVRERERSI